jgi:hypothetical protein
MAEADPQRLALQREAGDLVEQQAVCLAPSAADFPVLVVFDESTPVGAHPNMRRTRTDAGDWRIGSFRKRHGQIGLEVLVHQQEPPFGGDPDATVPGCERGLRQKVQ